MEVALVVGGAFLSSFLAISFERSSTTREFIEFFQSKKVIEFDEEILERLENTMLAISKVLEDAEDKERKSPPVRRWLEKLKHSVTHADDLLDELNYELLRLKLDYELQHNQTRAAPVLCLGSATAQDPQTSRASLNPALVEKLMPNFEKVTATLEKFENQSERLGLQKLDPKKNFPYREPSSSVVDKSMIDKSQFFGRDDEKEKLMKMVLHDEGASNVSVIAITGMGGIGKTTLAQLVYNDDRVKNKFQTRAWVCVSEEYNAHRITKDLLMEFNSVQTEDSFNGLQVKLKDNLAGKCFLIILDDIWNENPNDWSSLKTPLSYGGGGSKILITTRNEKVALMMQTETFDNLRPMPEYQSWRLFEKQAFDNGDHTPLHEFVKIGVEIVKKCKGLPLAIKTVAGALRLEKGIKVWQDFLSSEDWAAGGDILPALSLSYKHLPFHLKSCFAFCSLFHKDIPFDKDEVVQLWMANDLIKPSTQKAGRRCFEELKSRSFFEPVDEKVYLMHDLINDLARFVAGNTCIRLEDYQLADRYNSIRGENELPQELLHFSYLNNSDETAERFSRLGQAQSLRTFLPIHQSWWARSQNDITTSFFSDIVPRLKRLRALNLSRYKITMVPDSIGDLKHLRLLNLASTHIKKLPNAVSKCLNLQTLILANCNELVELPDDMRLLVNLQHLDVRGVGEPLIKSMASWLRMFEDIPNISIVVDKIYGNVLEHLDKLQPCHSLEIIELGDTDVDTTAGAKREEPKDKDCIENLTLEWGSVAVSSENELNKFAKLEPHTNIKQLSIKGYEGTRFPDWLGDSAFSNLESLSLKDCNNCFSLPSLGQLTGLKKLEIFDMDRINEIGEEFYGDASTSKPFQALQELHISHCNNILSFPEGGLTAPNLKSLIVWECSKMKSLPARMHTQLPLLTELRIQNCREIECFPEGGLPSSLEILWIRNCKKMRNCQTNWGLQTLPSLKRVWLSGFEDTLFPEEGLLPTTLQVLYISRFSNLESVKGLQQLSSLQTLRIEYCPKLQYLPHQKFSSSLFELYIESCPLVESFPEGLASSLSELRIWDSPKLAARIERAKGEDWPNVSHIPKIEIDYQLIQSDGEPVSSDDEITSSEPRVSRLASTLSELSIDVRRPPFRRFKRTGKANTSQSDQI